MDIIWHPLCWLRTKQGLLFHSVERWGEEMVCFPGLQGLACIPVKHTMGQARTRIQDSIHTASEQKIVEPQPQGPPPPPPPHHFWENMVFSKSHKRILCQGIQLQGNINYAVSKFPTIVPLKKYIEESLIFSCSLWGSATTAFTIMKQAFPDCTEREPYSVCVRQMLLEDSIVIAFVCCVHHSVCMHACVSACVTERATEPKLQRKTISFLQK